METEELTVAAALLSKRALRALRVFLFAVDQYKKEFDFVHPRTFDSVVIEHGATYPSDDAQQAHCKLNGPLNQEWFCKSVLFSAELAKAHNTVYLTLKDRIVTESHHPALDAIVVWLEEIRSALDTAIKSLSLLSGPSSVLAIDEELIKDKLNDVQNLSRCICKGQKIADKLLDGARKVSKSHFGGVHPYEWHVGGDTGPEELCGASLQLLVAFKYKEPAILGQLVLTRNEFGAPFNGDRNFTSGFLTRVKKEITELSADHLQQGRLQGETRLSHLQEIISVFGQPQPTPYRHIAEDYYHLVDAAGRLEHLSSKAGEILEENEIGDKRSKSLLDDFKSQ